MSSQILISQNFRPNGLRMRSWKIKTKLDFWKAYAILTLKFKQKFDFYEHWLGPNDWLCYYKLTNDEIKLLKQLMN